MTPQEELTLRATVEAQGRIITVLCALLMATDTLEAGDLQDFLIDTAAAIADTGPIEAAAADQLRRFARHLDPAVVPAERKPPTPS